MSRAVGFCPAECALTPATPPDAPSVTHVAEVSELPQPPDPRLELRDKLVEPCGPLSWQPPSVGGSSRDPAASATTIVASFDDVPVLAERHAN